MSAGPNRFDLLQLLHFGLYMSLTDFFVIYALLFYIGQCACVPIIVFIEQSNLLTQNGRCAENGRLKPINTSYKMARGSASRERSMACA